MADTATPKRRSEFMSNIRAKGAKSEMAVRHMPHALGYRNRLHGQNCPGKLTWRSRVTENQADIVKLGLQVLVVWKCNAMDDYTANHILDFLCLYAL